MKVSLIAGDLNPEDPIGACIVRQVQFFRERGDDVCVYLAQAGPVNLPDVAGMRRALGDAPFHQTRRQALVDREPEHFRLSDLVVYHYAGWHELMDSIRAVDRGTVFFHYHDLVPAGPAGQPWRVLDGEGGEGLALAAYADLCLADSPAGRQELVEHGGCPPADPPPIHVLPLDLPPEETSARLGRIVDDALSYLPLDLLLESATASTEATRPDRSAIEDRLLLRALAEELDARGDVALRGYVVRSRVPLIGPLIAWVRRSLTSHLREPYLDPTIERQVSFNRAVAEWLQRAVAALAAAGERQARLEARLAALEAELEAQRRPSAPPPSGPTGEDQP